MLASGGMDELLRLIAPGIAIGLFFAIRELKKSKATPPKAPPPAPPQAKRPTLTPGQLDVPIQLPTSATPFAGCR